MASTRRASAPSTGGSRLSSAFSTIPATRDNARCRSKSVGTHIPRLVPPLVLRRQAGGPPSGHPAFPHPGLCPHLAFGTRGFVTQIFVPPRVGQTKANTSLMVTTPCTADVL